MKLEESQELQTLSPVIVFLLLRPWVAYHILSIPHNPRGLFPVCFLPPIESSAFPATPPAAPPTESVVSLTVLPAPLAVFPTPSVTPLTVPPTPFPRPASGYIRYLQSPILTKDLPPTTLPVVSVTPVEPSISIHTRD